MIRFSLLIAGLLVALLSVGCCGPMGCGPGCGPVACNDCNGDCGQTIPYGPLDGMRQFKRSLVCGGGCGEAYIGEWISTPPDACDPCCGDQWVGGATACRPFCWQPGALLSRLNLYGKRWSASGDCCGVDCCGCDSCDQGYTNYEGYEEVEVMDGGVISAGGISGGSNCGCASCGNSSGMSRVSQRMPMSGGRDLSTRMMDQRVNRIRR